MICPDCAHANPEGTVYCHGCRRSLAGAHVTERAGSLAAMSDERRLVTVLFVDVVGSTSMAAQLDAEDWKALISGAFATLAPPIYRYGGTIPQFLGDGFLALFGAPVAHEDDPQRAVRSALDVIEAAERYAEEVRAGAGFDFAVRIGINTGPVIFGAVGTDDHREFLAVGETVNVAARLQALAEPMSALMSETTRRLLPAGFGLKDAGVVEVRGIDSPIAAFTPRHAPVDAESGARALSFASPMVGRRAELEQLETSAAGARTGVGQIVLVLGEPGIGKSRLLREWRAIATNSGMQWAQANMPAYASGEAYRFAAEALRAILELGPSAQMADVDAALDRAPEARRVPGARRHLAALLSVATGEGDDAESLSPQGRQARYIELARALVREAAAEPLVIVLNDAHWSDSSSISLLAPLLTLHAELPLLVCIVARPDADAPGWRLATLAREVGGSGRLELSLDALPPGATNQLVANLLGSDSLPDGLAEFVDGRADGNPLFVEEVVRMLVDRGVLTPAGDGWQFDAGGSERVPETLEALLAARIDRLDNDARTALRVASVIGRRFPVPVLERMLEQAT